MGDREWELRAILFRMLARGLTCPDKDMCEAIDEGSFAAEAREAFGIGVGSEDESRALEDALEALARMAEAPDLLEALRREYTRLFTAPQNAVIPVWETLFLNSGKTRDDFGTILIRSKEAVDARRRYKAAGLDMAAQESADHMRIECEFAGYLCQRVQFAETERDRGIWAEHLDGFAAVHLDRWFGPFFDTLAAHAQHPFYRAIAALGQSVDVGKLKR